MIDQVVRSMALMQLANYSRSIPVLTLIAAILILSLTIAPLMAQQKAFAHFDHFSHYNNRGDSLGPYYAYEALDPEYARPNDPTAMLFSIQDKDGHDTYNLVTMVEVYSAATGER